MCDASVELNIYVIILKKAETGENISETIEMIHEDNWSLNKIYTWFLY